MQEHVIIQCPLSQDCFVRVSTWGTVTQEAIDILMQILTVQKECGVFPSAETVQQRKISLLQKPDEAASEAEGA